MLCCSLSNRDSCIARRYCVSGYIFFASWGCSHRLTLLSCLTATLLSQVLTLGLYHRWLVERCLCRCLYPVVNVPGVLLSILLSTGYHVTRLEMCQQPSKTPKELYPIYSQNKRKQPFLPYMGVGYLPNITKNSNQTLSCGTLH